MIIQIELSAVNGVSAVSLTHNEEGSQEAAIITDEKEIIKRSNISVASIFLQCMHEDMSEHKHLLINKQQELVADLLLDKIQLAVKCCEPSVLSLTYVPFYDGSISASKKKLLGEVKLHPLIESKVEAYKLVNLSEENNRRQSVRTKD
jgi:hypothetical protein